ncbi:unnamed protein product [Cyprideis torosa]|uniref:Lipocalin/cytosolic fatty-acid binding domain-containing protein n=1 Tax=Cyprideis torosa TaxID=163714 RepID=A0A7R8ZRL5_9CRUS|nr:unnamed protein product [Cyprideis torosa]CAG0904105.1 unnamed protein product [Cyprideis torosa]
MAKLMGATKLVFTSDNFDAQTQLHESKRMLSVKPEESGGEWKMTTAKSTIKKLQLSACDNMSKLLGAWRLVFTSDTFEAYMIEVGVNLPNRKLMMTVSPDLFIEENKGEWTITAKSAIRTVVVKFRLGEEFTETRADGVTMQSIFTKDGENKLIQVQKGIATGGGDSVITREVVNNDTELLVTCVANSVTGIRKYNRLAEGPGGASTLPSKSQKRGGQQDSAASVGQSKTGKN